MKKFRLYLDTSVFGGCFDVEFATVSNKLFELVSADRIIVVVSDVILKELERAPQEVKNLLKLFSDNFELITTDLQSLMLRDKYIQKGILSQKWSDDALHVALATSSRADAIVSWNFKHIVRFDKMKAFNQVNFEEGYGVLTIISPKEVNLDDE